MTNADPTERIDIERLRLPSTPACGPNDAERTTNTLPNKAKAQRVVGEFLKGPIPLPWLSAVTRLPGKAPLALGLGLWFEAGRRRTKRVKLTTGILTRFNLNRKAKYRALQAMEKAGLIRLESKVGKNPIVTILDANA